MLDRTGDSTASVAWGRGDTNQVLIRLPFDVLGTFNVATSTYLLTVNAVKQPQTSPAFGTQLFQIAGAVVDAPNGVLGFTPAAGVTNVAPGAYYYDLQVTEAGGAVRTLWVARALIVQDITKTADPVGGNDVFFTTSAPVTTGAAPTNLATPVDMYRAAVTTSGSLGMEVLNLQDPAAGVLLGTPRLIEYDLDGNVADSLRITADSQIFDASGGNPVLVNSIDIADRDGFVILQWMGTFWFCPPFAFNGAVFNV